MDHETQELLAELTHWRQNNRPPTRIPEHFWARATDVAARHGISATARILRLGHTALKRRVDRGDQIPAAADFIKLLQPPVQAGQAAECVLEVQAVSGAKLRVEGARLNTSDLVSLVREFVN